MPAGGRPALSDEKIEKIATWIKENATFDGPGQDANIDVVINTAWASTASHDELFTKRQKAAADKWRRVLPNDSPSMAANKELFLLGNIPQTEIDSLLLEFAKSTELVKKQLAAPNNQPLVRGGLAVFVVKNRYDYGEFGRMTEKRELPRQWLGHWHADPVDVYGTVVGEPTADTPIASLATQIVAGAYLGSFDQVPNWFAEGVARNLVINNHRKNDQRIKGWQQSMATAAGLVPNSKALLDDKLDEEVSGIVGMAITNTMLARNQRSRFNLLVTRLREGKSFTEAMQASFAKPEDFLKAWVGK
jgi:hypothetical protein